MGAWSRIGKERMFFFEKKNQKTFVPLVSFVSRCVSKESKVFCFFFQKRSAFLKINVLPVWPPAPATLQGQKASA
jgi:hypothetical protein